MGDLADLNIECQQALEACLHQVIDHDVSAGWIVQEAIAPLTDLAENPMPATWSLENDQAVLAMLRRMT